MYHCFFAAMFVCLIKNTRGHASYRWPPAKLCSATLSAGRSNLKVVSAIFAGINTIFFVSWFLSFSSLELAEFFTRQHSQYNTIPVKFHFICNNVTPWQQDCWIGEIYWTGLDWVLRGSPSKLTQFQRLDYSSRLSQANQKMTGKQTNAGFLRLFPLSFLYFHSLFFIFKIRANTV